MLFQILHPCSAEFADKLTAFNFKVGEVVIPDEGVVQSVLAVVNFERECIHGISSLSCGLDRKVTLQRVAGCAVSSPSVHSVYHTTILERKRRNPNPSPIGTKFRFLKYGGA